MAVEPQPPGVPEGWSVVSFDSNPSAATPPRSTFVEGRRSAASSGREGDESSWSSWFDQNMRPGLESLAHPMTLDDIGHLLSAEVDATRGIGVKALTAVLDKVSKTREGLRDIADALIKRKLGIDPDAIDLATARMRLQAARSATRQANMTADMAAVKGAATPSAAEPLAPAAPAAAPPAAPPVAPASPTVPVAAQSPPAPTNAPAPAGPSPVMVSPATAEAASREYVRLIRAGKTPTEAQQMVLSQLELAKRLGATDAQAVRSAVATRNATGRWRE